MNSAYTQDLIHQRDRANAERRAAENELGKLRRRVDELLGQRDVAQAAARERAALLEHARDLLEPWGGHGDAWPDIAPAIEELTRQLAATQKTSARRRAQMLDAEAAVDTVEAERDACRQRAEQAEARIAAVRAAVHVADDHDVTDWQRGYRACAERAQAALDRAAP